MSILDKEPRQIVGEQIQSSLPITQVKEWITRVAFAINYDGILQSPC